MGTSTVHLAHGRPFTVDDLEAMPDDGNRYELIDGMLIVSPIPGRRHQRAVPPSWPRLVHQTWK